MWNESIAQYNGVYTHTMPNKKWFAFKLSFDAMTGRVLWGLCCTLVSYLKCFAVGAVWFVFGRQGPWVEGPNRFQRKYISHISCRDYACNLNLLFICRISSWYGCKSNLYGDTNSIRLHSSGKLRFNMSLEWHTGVGKEIQIWINRMERDIVGWWIINKRKIQIKYAFHLYTGMIAFI